MKPKSEQPRESGRQSGKNLGGVGGEPSCERARTQERERCVDKDQIDTEFADPIADSGPFGVEEIPIVSMSGARTITTIVAVLTSEPPAMRAIRKIAVSAALVDTPMANAGWSTVR